MVISHTYKFIFVKTAKTAGTSIEVHLSNVCPATDVFTPFTVPESGHVPRNYRGRFNPVPELVSGSRRGVPRRESNWKRTLSEFREGVRFFHHMPAWEIRSRVSKHTWQSYFKFCVERSPWDKIVSGWRWYNYKRGGNVSFDDYLDFCEERIERRKPGVGICPYNFPIYTDPLSEAVIVDRIIRYEDLTGQLKETLSGLGVPIDGLLQRKAKDSQALSKDTPVMHFTDKQVERISAMFHQEIALHGYSFSPESRI